LRQALDHARREDRGMALHGYPQQKTDLVIEHVALAGKAWMLPLRL